MRPSYTLLFKLIRCGNEFQKHDKEVAWGIFPLLNSELQVNEGRYKCPLLYGFGYNNVYKYRDIEDAVKHDLDKWLCNMYFEIEPLKIDNVRVHQRNKTIYY